MKDRISLLVLAVPYPVSENGNSDISDCSIHSTSFLHLPTAAV